MIDLALRQAPNLISGKGSPPAEIYFLHVGKELFFQALEFVPDAASYNHAGP